MGKFADAVSQFAVKVDERGSKVVQYVGIELLNRIVLRSPVGNPDLWASNAAANLWNRGADDVNAELRLREGNLTKSGRLKRGLKIKSKALKSPEGYVGGRLRGSWTITLDAPFAGDAQRIDPSGNATIAAGVGALSNFKAGPTIYLTSNLPYSIPCEYGHSHQAPNGMVRITVAEFQEILAEATRAVPE